MPDVLGSETSIAEAATEAGWRNAAHVGAFRKGWLAKLEGRPNASPYRDHRTYRGGVTFSRSFEKAWKEGFDAAP